ncbi:MAG: BON domain-containing protein [Myxococcota bacterium]
MELMGLKGGRGILAPAMFLGAVALGTELMFWLDPLSGRRRRALTRDKMVHAAHEIREGAQVTAMDVSNRSRGLFYALRTRFRREAVPDNVLEERVRAKLGRYCSHPHAVIVFAQDGRVRLSGPILAEEAERTLHAVRSIPGVTHVDDALERGGTDHPALQGGMTRAGEVPELLQQNWSPATKLAVGLGGTVLGLFVLKGLQVLRKPRYAFLALPLFRRLRYRF